MIEQSIIKLLDGKCDFDTLEYFDLNSTQRDKLAKDIVNHFFKQIIKDEHYRLFYLDFIDYRLEQLLKEELYESVDLYQRLKKQLIIS